MKLPITRELAKKLKLPAKAISRMYGLLQTNFTFMIKPVSFFELGCRISFSTQINTASNYLFIFFKIEF